MAKKWESNWTAYLRDGSGVLEAQVYGGEVLVTASDGGHTAVRHAIPLAIFKDWAQTVLKQIGE